MLKMPGFLAGWMAASLVSVAQTAPKKIDNDLVFNREKYSQKKYQSSRETSDQTGIPIFGKNRGSRYEIRYLLYRF
jgi:hypothetical protein